MTDPIIFCPNAARKVFELIEEEGNFNLNLRVYVTGGGCSGMQYGFSFDETINEDDTVVERKLDRSAVKLLVDPMSFQYLVGAELITKKILKAPSLSFETPMPKRLAGAVLLSPLNSVLLIPLLNPILFLWLRSSGIESVQAITHFFIRALLGWLF